MKTIQVVHYKSASPIVQGLLDALIHEMSEIQQTLLPRRNWTMTIAGLIVSLIVVYATKTSLIVLPIIFYLWYLAKVEEADFWRLNYLERFKLLLARTKSALLPSISYEARMEEARAIRLTTEDLGRKTGSRQNSRNLFLTLQISACLLAAIDMTLPSPFKFTGLLAFLQSQWFALVCDGVVFIITAIVSYRTWRLLTPRLSRLTTCIEHLVKVFDWEKQTIYLGAMPQDVINQLTASYPGEPPPDLELYYAGNVEQIGLASIPIRLANFYP